MIKVKVGNEVPTPMGIGRITRFDKDGIYADFGDHDELREEYFSNEEIYAHISQLLIDAVIDQFRKDFAESDVTAIDGLLAHVPNDVLIQYLPEEMWGQFREVAITDRMILEFDDEHVSIDLFTNERMYPVVHWHCDEWNEDPSILPSIANAIHLYHTNRMELLMLVGFFKTNNL